MEFAHILGTETSAGVAPGQRLSFVMQHNMQHEIQQPHPQHFAPPPYLNGRVKSETGSDGAASPHASEQSSRYSSQPAQPLPQYSSVPSNMANGMRYPSPTAMQGPIPMLNNNYIPNQSHEPQYSQPPPDQHVHQPQQPGSRHSTGEAGPPKAFACSTCSKGFARRSDLARHERIHSGVRPHVCDFAGCGKQFIQRSALTVHQRVHTGEKPHMCERCGKPFSDSSSLARHRRIHSGKRPYKCPYADCQKTFTRRTTLTRHQNHHTGTVEEAAAATRAALASRASAPSRGTRSDAEEYSEVASPMPTPSPNRQMSLSPAGGMPVVPNMPRQTSDFGYMSGSLVPPHLRGQMQQPSPRSSPALSQSYNNAVNAQGRHSLTSHPTAYGPPQVLEPPTSTNHGGQNSNAGGSANGSPHMGNVGWQSPQPQQGMASPGPAEGYVYPEPQYGAAAPGLYYPNSNIRRPHSTEPDQYDARQRMSGDMWAAPPVQ